jgi:fucose permease
VVTFFLATFCFSCFESTLAVLVSDNFNLNVQSEDAQSTASVIFLFCYCGIIGAFVQGGLIGRMVKKLGEPKLIGLSLILTAISMAILPFITGTASLSWSVLFQYDGLPWVWMLFALALLAVGSSLTRPPLFGLLSNLTPANEQGATIGVAQGAGSLARILGPLFALPLVMPGRLISSSVPHSWLAYVPTWPYLTCTVVLLGTSALVFQRLSSEKAVVDAGPAVPVE